MARCGAKASLWEDLIVVEFATMSPDLLGGTSTLANTHDSETGAARIIHQHNLQ